MENSSLPPSFSRPPGEDIHHYFRNILLDFKKIIHHSQNIDELEHQMIAIINASRDICWKNDPYEVIRKSNAEKLLDKLFTECRRYIEDLQKDLISANNEYLSVALEELLDLFSES